MNFDNFFPTREVNGCFIPSRQLREQFMSGEIQPYLRNVDGSRALVKVRLEFNIKRLDKNRLELRIWGYHIDDDVPLLECTSELPFDKTTGTIEVYLPDDTEVYLPIELTDR